MCAIAPPRSPWTWWLPCSARARSCAATSGSCQPSNPTRSICAIEGGEVTGRTLEMGTTTLLVDLMRRVNQNQDKLNYELDIGARRFKCTTIPILRKDYGVVGALCINIDINYISDYVQASAERTAEFLRQYCHSDMKLDENILSKDEYRLALAGKRHFRDAGPPS